jgi:hypothetical protein
MRDECLPIDDETGVFATAPAICSAQSQLRPKFFPTVLTEIAFDSLVGFRLALVFEDDSVSRIPTFNY